MTLHLDLDALEICRCGRLICNDDHCVVLQRLAGGTFYSEPVADVEVPPDAPTPAEWAAMQGAWPGRVADRRQRDRGRAA